MALDIIGLIRSVAESQGVDPDLMLKLVKQESNFDPNALGPQTKSGRAIGLTQLMPSTAKELSVNPHNVQQNIEGGTRYLKQQLNRFIAPSLALAAYNAGPDAAHRALQSYPETQKYVRNILGSDNETVKGNNTSPASTGNSMPTTTDTPFQPLMSQLSQATPESSSPALVETPPASEPLFTPYPKPIFGPGGTGQSAKLGTDTSEKEGFWPGFIATVAALNGQFGPLIQLQEQRRKTALSRELQPSLVQINEMINQGKTKEAQALTQQVFGRLGPRSPEIAAHLTSLTNKISGIEADFTHNESAYSFWKNVIEEQEATTGKKHILRPELNALGKAIKDRTPFGQQLSNIIYNRMQVKSQVTEGGAAQFSESGNVDKVSLPSIFRVEDLSGYVGDTLASELQQQGVPLNNDQVATLLGGRVVTTSNGQVIEPTPQNISMLRNRIAQLQGVRAQIELGKQIPIEPVLASELSSLNVAPEKIASRTYTPEQAEQALVKRSQRIQRESAAQLYAKGDVPAINVGQYVLDIQTGQLVPGISTSKAISQPDRYAVFPDEKRFAQAEQLFNIRNRIAMVVGLLQDPSLPDGGSLIGRARSYGERELNARLGINPDFTGQQAAQTIAKDAIEILVNRLGVKAERYDYLTRQITDSLVNKQGIEAGLRQIDSLLQVEFNTSVSQGRREVTGSAGDNFKLLQPGTGATSTPSTVPSQGSTPVPVKKPGVIPGTLR